jgi:hypothetical protein
MRGTQHEAPRRNGVERFFCARSFCSTPSFYDWPAVCHLQKPDRPRWPARVAGGLESKAPRKAKSEVRREASLLQNSLSELHLKAVSSRLSMPDARHCISPPRRRPLSAPPGGGSGHRLIHKERWRGARAGGEESAAFAMRLGWQTKLPDNEPSFLEMKRKESGLATSRGEVRLDRKGVNDVLQRLNRPRSAPPRQRGGGELSGWVGPQGRLEVAKFKSLLPPQSWPLPGHDVGYKWIKAKGGLDISDQPRRRKGAHRPQSGAKYHA